MVKLILLVALTALLLQVTYPLYQTYKLLYELTSTEILIELSQSSSEL